MGRRKKNNQARAQQRLVAKARREKNKIKRENKAKTSGQQLHDLMHGRKEDK